MSMRESVPIVIFLVSVMFGACATFVFAKFGTRALWLTALIQAGLAIVFLWAIGWARTPESPFFISVLMVAAVTGAIASTVQAIGTRRPVLATVISAVSGLIASYVGIIVGYILMVYTI